MSAHLLRTGRLGWLLHIAALAVVALGCHFPPPVYVVQARPRAVRVPEAPPPRRLEIPPAPPDESYVWQEGYWSWDEGEYQWLEGRWMPPRDGYVFMAASYTFVDNCWQFSPPYWCPASDCGGQLGPGHRGRHYVEAPKPTYEPAPSPQAQRSAGPVVLPPMHVKASAPATAKAVAPPSPDEPVKLPLPAWDEERKEWLKNGPRRRPIVLQEDDGPAASEPVIDEPRSRTELADHPEFLGTRAGRPVFGDDPTAVRPPPGFRVDRTGALVSEGSRGPRRMMVLSQPATEATVEVSTPAWRRRHYAPPQSVIVPPPVRPDPPVARTVWSSRPEPPRAVWSAPIARPEPPPRIVWQAPIRHEPSPVYSAPSRPAPQPVYAPQPVHAPPPARIMHSAPVMHAAPAPVRMAAPVAAPSMPVMRRHR